MQQTKFNIIIATRNRVDTLQWALKTCLNQNYENFQVFVSDNFSQDNTREVVESFYDSRIIYLNTGKPLSMSHNYEFALKHISDGYVTFMGDDDGLMPGALEYADKIISETGHVAIIGRLDEYYWNNCSDIERRGILRYRLGKKTKEEFSDSIIKDVLKLKKAYQNLPCIYNTGFISFEIIDKIKRISGGTFFHSCIPDVYSSFAIASVVPKFLFVDTTFILVGISGHSNGIAYFDPKGTKQIANNFFALDTIPFHNKLSICPSMAIMYAESFMQAKDRGLFSEDLDLKNVLETAMDEALTSPYLGNYDKIKKAVSEIIEINKIDKNFELKLFAKYKDDRSLLKIILSKLIRRFKSTDKFLQVKTSSKEILNIYDAVLFNEKLETKRNISYLQYKVHFIKEIFLSGKIFLTKRKKVI